MKFPEEKVPMSEKKLYYAEYQRLMTLEKEKPFTKKKYLRVLQNFFNITMSPRVFGDLRKPDGTIWDSSFEAVEYWGEKNKLSRTQVKAFYNSVDNIHEYT